MGSIRLSCIFKWSFGIALLVVGIKLSLHHLGFEPIAQTSLHNSVISSVIFVIGFLLSATIADYKESEKIPAEFASLVEDIYEDAKALQKNYPDFAIQDLRKNLIDILDVFREGTRSKRRTVRQEIHDLHLTFSEMEKAGVPPNFITKLKTQQAQLLKSIFRVNYIQKIVFIPSAVQLAWSIVVMVIAMVLLTDVDPSYGGLALSGIISFIMVYMLLLIRVISVPFHLAGRTQDDVSLFLLHETKKYLQDEAGVTSPRPTTRKRRASA